MCWLKRDRWKAGITIASILLLLVLMVWVPASAVGAHERALGIVEPGTGTVQVTPTEDATVNALNKEMLTQQVAQQQHTWENWLWSNAATIVSSFLLTLVVVIGVLFGLGRWRVDQRAAQDKEAKAHQVAQDKELEDRKAERERRDEEQKRWLKDQEAEREKRTEERFQAAVMGLGDQKDAARISAVILLRTFLRPGYEQFYTQIFDLAVAHLRLPRTPDSLEDPNTTVPLTTLRQALIVVFKETFPLARSQNNEGPQSLDATGIQLDNAYLWKADLKQAWMPQASLREANLSEANLSEANLSKANLNRANLSGTNLSEARLNRAILGEADLRGATLRETDLIHADLIQADLIQADLSRATLIQAKLIQAKFIHSRLNRTTFIQADLRGADLRGADLQETNLREADLRGADLREANLREANLRGANLRGADLRGATLSGTRLEGALLRDTNLRGVFGLTKEQLESSNARWAVIDEDPTTTSSLSPIPTLPTLQSGDSQTPPSPLAQGNRPTPDIDGSIALSSQLSDGAQAQSARPAQGSIPTSDAGGSSVASSKPDPES